jgi:hypothetical protein
MSSFNNGFGIGFLHGRAHEQIERERVAELQRPIPKNINPPELLAPTKVRVLRPFYVAGKVAGVGSVVCIDSFTARSLAAIGKCEVLK